MTDSTGVPWPGLARVLADWSGVGTLYDAIASIAPDTPFGRDWTGSDVERRAMRVLLLQCQPSIAQWPATLRTWLDQLPLVSNRHRYWSSRPVPRVDWASTRRRGWPPDSFAIRRRHRSSDQIPLAVLGWTINELNDAVEMTRQLLGLNSQIADLVDASIAPKLQTALGLQDVIDAQDSGLPSAEDLAALRGMGWPWNSIARVAGIFAARYRRDGVEQLAKALIGPQGFPDKLFQLAVLGTVLSAAERADASVTSIRPIGDMTSGPVYRIRDIHDRNWDVWCEAERCWSFYDVVDHYYEIATALSYPDGLPYKRRHLRPDILVALPGIKAVVVECKFSADPGYIASGLNQAHYYGTQLSERFLSTEAFVTGPTDVVRRHSEREVGAVLAGIGTPSLIGNRIEDLVCRQYDAPRWQSPTLSSRKSDVDAASQH